MKPLSERLMAMAKSNMWAAELMMEAAALAKRYEDAPVGTLEDVVDDISYVKWGFSEGDSFPGAPKLRTLDGQRVRIVLDKEG